MPAPIPRSNRRRVIHDIDETDDRIAVYDNSAADLRSAAFTRLQSYIDKRFFAVPKNFGVEVKSVSPYEVDITASPRGAAIVVTNGAGYASFTFQVQDGGGTAASDPVKSGSRKGAGKQ